MRRHERADAGFTLTELLVTLTIVGVLGAATVGMLVRQNGFYTRTGDLQYANQSVRGTADLVASELRAVSGEDILYSRSDSLRVRYDVRQALEIGVASGIDAACGHAASRSAVGRHAQGAGRWSKSSLDR